MWTRAAADTNNVFEDFLLAENWMSFEALVWLNITIICDDVFWERRILLAVSVLASIIRQWRRIELHHTVDSCAEFAWFYKNIQIIQGPTHLRRELNAPYPRISRREICGFSVTGRYSGTKGKFLSTNRKGITPAPHVISSSLWSPDPFIKALIRCFRSNYSGTRIKS